MKAALRWLTQQNERRFIQRGFVAHDHTIAGRNLRVYEAKGQGDQGTVVCFHGLSSNAPEYAPLLVRLVRSFSKVIAPDIPGHGHSALFPGRGATWLEPLFLALALHTHDDDVTAYGNSLGGYVAIRWQQHAHHPVQRMFLSSPGGAQMSVAEAAAMRRVFTFSQRRHADAFVGNLLRRPPWYRPLIASMIQTRFARSEIRVLVDGITPENLLVARDIETIGIPTIVEWGQDDRIQPPSQLAFFQRHAPATMTITEPAGVGHCPHMEDARALAERVVAFARR